MRIIAGELRGRRIAAPKGRATRPMLERVREAIFSTLAPWFPDAQVVDLFAGSGSLGLEALSRGAAHVAFVEAKRERARCIGDNAEDLGLDPGRYSLHAADALAPRAWLEGGADVVFCDPPFELLRSERGAVFGLIDRTLAGGLRAEGVICLHAPAGLLSPERDFPADAVARERRYGAQSIFYLQAP